MRCLWLSLLAGLTTIFVNEAWTQNFSFVATDTALSAPLGSEIVFNCTLTNISGLTLTLGLARTLNDLPAVWESSMCLDVCYPSSTDSVMTTAAFGSSPLNPGESRPFSVHVYTSTNNGTGTVRIVVWDTRNLSDERSLTFTATSLPAAVKSDMQLPGSTSLSQNYPNPFNPVTNIKYQTASTSSVTLKVFDVLGREVATLVNEVKEPGRYTVQWDASGFASGVYYYQLRSQGLVQTRSLLLER